MKATTRPEQMTTDALDPAVLDTAFVPLLRDYQAIKFFVGVLNATLIVDKVLMDLALIGIPMGQRQDPLAVRLAEIAAELAEDLGGGVPLGLFEPDPEAVRLKVLAIATAPPRGPGNQPASPAASKPKARAKVKAKS